MKQLLKSILLAASVAFCGGATAQTASYDGATRYLTIPSVRVGDTIFSDLVIRLDGIAVISVGQTNPAVAVAEKCTLANFTVAKLNAIQAGMTASEISQIIGCNYSSSMTTRGVDFVEYVWVSLPDSALISVFFDANGVKATPFAGLLKSGAGF